VNVLVLDTEVYSNTGGQQSKATPLGAAAKFASAGKATRKKDLGLLAMSYGHVYVAEVAMQARSASRRWRPSSRPSATRGPRSSSPTAPASRTATTSCSRPRSRSAPSTAAMWPLYRFDPRRVDAGQSPLCLDSGGPEARRRKYMENEARFRMVELRDPERYAALVAASRDAIAAQRRALYEQLAQVHLPKETTHG
jgi:pyruvate-ferredoxin/flavodoxin oxidoreductase